MADETEGQLTGDAGDTDETAAESSEAGVADAARIAELEGQLAELKSMVESGRQQQQEPAFEPKPLFTEEELQQMDDDRRAYSKALNAIEMNRQRDKHEAEKRIAQLEAGNEDRGHEQSIQDYIASTPELAKDAALATAFKRQIKRTLDGDGMDLLDAVKAKVLLGAKGKPDSAGSTGKPRSVAGSVRKDVKRFTNYEDGFADAKKEILNKGT